MSWRLVVRHDGLGKVRVVTAPEHDLLQERAGAVLATWEAEWQRKLAKQQVAEAKEQARLRVYQTKAQAEQSAKERTARVQAEWQDLEAILKITIQHDYARDWELLKRNDRFSKLGPEKPTFVAIPTPPQPDLPSFKPSLIGRLIPSSQRRRLQLHNRENEAKLRAWQEEADSIAVKNEFAVRQLQTQHEKAVLEYRREQEQFELEKKEWNADVEERKKLFLQGDTDALLSYWNDLFSDQPYPDTWPDDVRLDFITETKTLVIDYELPNINHFPKVKDVRYVASRQEFKETPVAESHQKKLYDETLYQIALASLYKVFHSDSVDALASVVFNGWVHSIDKATGVAIRPCILSIQTSKMEFLTLNMAQVDPRACFKKLKGISAARLHDITPVQPVLTFDKSDKRFVESYGVADSLNEATNLASMDWQDFENLIRELFEKEFSQNGGDVKITQASRDGGVDAVAFDPDPIRGGKIVIQAKRYTNCVGVSAVRDLYGTVHNEGATKGILVTTSDFGSDAYEFAKGKPLTLLSGSELLYLLERHGYKARIDIAEAKRLSG